MVSISPFWAEKDQEIIHANKFQQVVENGLKLTELGLIDLGYEKDHKVKSVLYHVDDNVDTVPAGIAYGKSFFTIYLRDSLSCTEGSARAISHIGLTGLHETVHCLRFSEFPELNDKELKASEVVAYGSEFAHSVMYYGGPQDIERSHSPNHGASLNIMRMLLSEKPLTLFLTMSPEEIDML